MTFVPRTNDIQIEQLAKGATLLLCAVSTGNVPQLSVDLLLSTLPHTLLGNFHSQHVLPCVGGHALAAAAPPTAARKAKAKAAAAAAPAVLTTAMQLFSIPSLRLLVMQQRAPAIRGRHRALVNELTAWSSGLDLAQTVLLTSSLAFRRGDEELDAVHPVSFFLVDKAGAPASASASASATAPASGSSDLVTLLRKTLQWNSLHHNVLQQDEAPFRFDQLNSAEEADRDVIDPMRVGGGGGGGGRGDEAAAAAAAPIAVPGLGITRPLFELVSGSSAAAAVLSGSAPASLPPTLFLHVYCNEGANDRDAILFCASVYNFLFLQRQQQKDAQQAKADAANLQLVEPQDVVWTPPASWTSVFGNEPDESLYL